MDRPTAAAPASSNALICRDQSRTPVDNTRRVTPLTALRWGHASPVLTRAQVAEGLSISMPQCYALLRRGELRAAKIGGRGLYRIGRDDLEAYIERTYAETARWIKERPFTEGRGFLGQTTEPGLSMRPRPSSLLTPRSTGPRDGGQQHLLVGRIELGPRVAIDPPRLGLQQ